MQGFIDQVEVDLITNGVGSGPIAQDVASGRYSLEGRIGFDPGLLRPVIQEDGEKYFKYKTGRMVANKEGSPDFIVNRAAGEMVPESKYIPVRRLVRNGTVSPMALNSALPYQAWQMVDRAVLKASRNRLNAWNDLAAANTFGGFDGMAITGLIKDTMTDAGKAQVSMDEMHNDMSDAPLFTPDILPLPIIHSGAEIGQRRLAMSRNAGLPLDTTMIEQCGRRVAETLEKMTIGMTDFTGLKIGQSNVPSFTNQGIYGFRTQPDRITVQTITASASFDPATLLSDVLGMKEAARAQNFFGPFVLYYSTDWDEVLQRDYYVSIETANGTGMAAPTQTMRQRLMQIDGITSIKLLDNFTSTSELLLVQMTSETVRAVNGMDFTTVQWQKDGGAATVLRVLGIKVPDLRSQFIGTSTTSRKCGIVHGTTS